MFTHYTLKSILIPLTKKQFTRVSPADADLWRVKWCAHFFPNYTGGGKYSADRSVRKGDRRVTEYMHRVILSRKIGRELTRKERVDHIDLDPLNNRRDNLRVATPSQNAMNKGKHANGKSPYKGVYWHKHVKKWQASIRLNYKAIHLGYFDNPEDAHKAYCDKAKELFGEFARFE